MRKTVHAFRGKPGLLLGQPVVFRLKRYCFTRNQKSKRPSMRPWGKIDPSEFLKLKTRARQILHDIPVHDVWTLDLPGGGENRTIMDIRTLTEDLSPGQMVRFLFSFRHLLGRIFRLDKIARVEEQLFINRLTEEDRNRSLVPSGSKDGPFCALYVFENEALSEIRNRTVHAALVWVLVRHERGYKLLWAIYVKPVSWFTALYMYLIDPFRKWIVYPALLKGLYRSWCRKY